MDSHLKFALAAANAAAASFELQHYDQAQADVETALGAAHRVAAAHDKAYLLIRAAQIQRKIASAYARRPIVQRCFDAAYQRMKDDGLESDALDLKTATVHWLRHTGISEDVKIRPREHVRDDAGHSSMQTTDRYIESDLRERHESGRQKRVREL